MRHLLAEDYAYDSHHFLNDAVAHVLDITMLHDPERYDELEGYNSDRWLDETSPNFRACLTERLLGKGHDIFDRGKRACLG
jgi:cytochrome P450